MRVAHWITTATYTHSEYVISIAFPLQQWLRERASALRHTYNVRPVITETGRVHCAVRNESLNKILVARTVSGTTMVTPLVEGLLEIRGK